MSESTNVLEQLSQKAGVLVEQFAALRAENEMLRNELVQTKASNEQKDLEISKLQDDIIQKELELDEANKIVSNVSELLSSPFDFQQNLSTTSDNLASSSEDDNPLDQEDENK